MARGKTAAVVGYFECVPRRGAAGRHSENQRFQRWRQQRQRLFRRQPAARHSLEYLESVFETGIAAPESDHHDGLPRGTSAAGDDRIGTALHGHRVYGRRHAVAGDGQTGNLADGGRHRFAPIAATVRHRPGRLAARTRHHARARCAWRGRQFAGPLAAAYGL